MKIFDFWYFSKESLMASNSTFMTSELGKTPFQVIEFYFMEVSWSFKTIKVFLNFLGNHEG